MTDHSMSDKIINLKPPRVVRRREGLRITNPRLAKAKGVLKAAEATAAAQLWDSAVSRAYYASFHAAVVYLQETRSGRPPKSGRWSHDYVQMRFRQCVGAPEGKLVRRLYQARTVADYQMRKMNEKDAEIAIENAKAVLDFVKKSVGSPTTTTGAKGVT